MDGAGFFPVGRGKGQNFRGGAGAGQGKGQNLRVGAGRGKGQNLRGGAGQNLSISADLDNFRFEQNSIIWFACESIQERSLSVVSSVTIPPLNLKIWRLTSSLTLHYDASPIENGKLRNLPKWLPHPPFLEDMNCFRLNIWTQHLVSFTFWHIFGPSWSFREGKHFW